jgi:hypothetical protein
VPTIFEKDGYRVMIYTHDHGPPHVHVAHGDTIIAVSIAGGVARFREGSERRRKPDELEIRRAERIVSERIGDCIAAWTRYHGSSS